MPRINLLPWREELRKRRQREFAVAAAGAILLGVLVIMGAKQVYQGMINHQQERNGLLNSEIAQLDKQIAQIDNLEDQKERLLARMQIIDELQRSRPEIVHVFDELARRLPDGVYLTSVKQTGQRLEISGNAQSSTRVSAFMRAIDASAWLTDPNLQVIETQEQNGVRSAHFTVFANEVSVTDDDADQKESAP